MSQLNIFSAGCFRFVLPELVEQFGAKAGVTPKYELGASGLLAGAIANGASPEIFLSANKTWAHEVEKIWSRPVKSLCYDDLALITLKKTAEKYTDARDLLAAEDIVVGYTDPKIDPCGQYAEEMFRKILHWKKPLWESIKERRFIIGADLIHKCAEHGKTVAEELLNSGKIGVMVCYGSSIRAPRDLKDLAGVLLPKEIQTITAAYSVARNGMGEQFQEFCASHEGRKLFGKYGFYEGTVNAE